MLFLIRGSPSFVLLSLVTMAASVQAGPAASELEDVSARIEYGFLTEDKRTIRMARSSLDKFDEDEPWRLYYQALGAYRLARIGALKGERNSTRLASECIKQSTKAAKQRADFAESLILTAACSSMSLNADPVKSRTHRRRIDALLGKVRRLDPDNPRLPLVEALVLRVQPDSERTVDEQLFPLLEAARLAFEQSAFRREGPDWGEAETLAMLGEIHLNSGETRAARDLVEEALIIAPDYTFALQLQSRIGAGR